MEGAKVEQRDIVALFSRIDSDGDGTINHSELAKVLQAVDPDGWPDEMVSQLMESMDVDKDGRVDFDEFVHWAFSGEGSTLAAALGKGPCAETSAASEEKPAELDLPRFMLHDRRSEDYPRTSLRIHPIDAKEYKPQSAYNGEVVEVLGAEGNYVSVKIALSGAIGWLHRRYLHPCMECSSFDRLAARSNFKSVELLPTDGRLKEVRRYLRRRNTTRDGGDIRASQAWMLKGQSLGDVGKNGAKETMFFACRDSWANTISENGFDDVIQYMSGELGKGAAHFTPSSCKAFATSENYMFICEVMLGSEEERMTLDVPRPELTAPEMVDFGKLSVQVHAGRRFKHEERAVFNPTMCKPIYLLKLEFPGLGAFGGRIS